LFYCFSSFHPFTLSFIHPFHARDNRAKLQKIFDICKPKSKKIIINANLLQKIWKKQNLHRIFVADFDFGAQKSAKILHKNPKL